MFFRELEQMPLVVLAVAEAEAEAEAVAVAVAAADHRQEGSRMS